MYLTAQHVRSRAGEDDYQSYLHLHDFPGSEPFPKDPLTVPQSHPGLMVSKSLRLKPGGNGVLSYLDIVAHDAWWTQACPPGSSSSTEWWRQTLEPIGDLMEGKSVPWTVEAGEVFVIFNAGALMPHVSEYKDLLGVALGLWDEWRARSGGR